VGACVTKYTPTPFDRLGGVLEQQVRLIEEERQLRRRQVAHLGQRLVQLGEHPEHEGRVQARAIHDVRDLEQADDPLAIGARADELQDVELRLAEERACALLLERHDRAQDDAQAGRGDAAQVFEHGLAIVRAEELQRRPQIREVEQWQVLVVAVAEDQRQDARLGVVEVEDLAQEQRAEAADARPDLRTALAA
jgi:hypothetical protein